DGNLFNYATARIFLVSLEASKLKNDNTNYIKLYFPSYYKIDTIIGSSGKMWFYASIDVSLFDPNQNYYGFYFNYYDQEIISFQIIFLSDIYQAPIADIYISNISNHPNVLYDRYNISDADSNLYLSVSYGYSYFS
ncbi:hypothetical protein HZS_4255, partial [Henneguya salminicola]